MKFPSYLTSRKIWGTWKDDNGTKIPKRISGHNASSKNLKHWTSFEKVEKLSKKSITLHDQGLVGIDLDNCFDMEGNLRDWAEQPVAFCCEAGYGEISPSGRGLKFILVGKKPEGYGCESEVLGTNDPEDPYKKQQQIEIFDSGRYFTMTGNWFKDSRREIAVDASEVAEWICQNYIGKTAQPSKRVDRSSFAPNTLLDAEERASMYLESCQVPVTGGRNKAVFKAAGGLKTIEGLDDDRRLSLILWWNSKFPEPLSEQEVAKAVWSSGVNGKLPETRERDDLEFQSVALSEDECDALAAQLSSSPAVHVETAELTEAERAAEEFESLSRPRFGYPGLIDDIVEYNLSTAIYPLPALAFGAALSLVSTITGRKIRDKTNGRTNLMIIGVAPTGGGKDYARQVNKKLLVNAPDLFGPENINSAQGIPGALRHSPALLMQVDEIGKALEGVQKSKSDYKSEIISMLMRVESSSGGTWKPNAVGNAEHNYSIDDPHLVIYGTTVPKSLWGSMTKEQITDGFLNRFLIFEHDGYVLDNEDAVWTSPPDSIMERIEWWTSDFNGAGGNLGAENSDPYLVHYTPEAETRFKKHRRDINLKRMEEHEDRAAIWSRTAAKTAKLAMCFASSRCSVGELPLVDINDVDHAIKISNWSTRFLLKKAFQDIADTGFERKVQKALKIVENGAVSRSAFYRKMQSIASNARDINDIVKHLINTNDIISITVPTGGRPREVIGLPKDLMQEVPQKASQ